MSTKHAHKFCAFDSRENVLCTIELTGDLCLAPLSFRRTPLLLDTLMSTEEIKEHRYATNTRKGLLVVLQCGDGCGERDKLILWCF